MSYDLRQHDITVVLTSCGRKDVLLQTLAGFHKYYKPARFIVIEDKADKDIERAVKAAFPNIEMVLNSPQLGQMASIDKAYSMVTSKYIFHMEDDREPSGYNNIADCLALLDKNECLSGICLNNMVDVPQKYWKYDELKEGDTTFYYMQVKAHPEWFGYSFNPSLLKREIWLQHQPFKGFVTEENLSLKMKVLNKSVAYVIPGFFQHIGYNMHVNDPMQPKRKRNFWGRQMRSIEKRWNRLKRKFQSS